MGRKRVIVVSSSDEEGEERRDGKRGGSCSSSKSKSRLRSGASSVGPKRAGSRGRLHTGARSSNATPLKGEEVNFDNLSEEFYGCLHGLHVVPSGFKKMETEELWIEKFRPCSSAELAVHKKKVEDIRKWLEERMAMSKAEAGKNVLLLTGQAGVGKSVVVQVLASQLGAELCEWRTPTPTLWQEHLHNSSWDIRYVSKLDEFEIFVEQVRKYPLLLSTSTARYRKPVVLLIDDLPVTNGRTAFGRLSKSLHLLVHSVQVPTIILMTDSPNHDPGDNAPRRCEGLEASLERAGACKVSLNPITVNSIKKCLIRICQEEKYKVSEEWITLIAKASGGDIRHAITSLQYLCLGAVQSLASPPTITSIHCMESPDRISALPLLKIQSEDVLNSNFSLPFGRDETLSLFHALGKFLHNKREAYNTSGKYSFLLKEKFSRCPLKSGDPEKILSQAHGQARTIADFLHENVLDFINDEAIGDAWTVVSYLSDADCLLSTALHLRSPRMVAGIYEPEHICQSAAASVAVRGVLFGNSHPSSSRWHSIRSPKLWQVQHSSRSNKNELVMQRFGAYGSLNLSSNSDIATDYRPATRWLGSRVMADSHLIGESQQSCELEDFDSDLSERSSFKEESSMEGSEEDEIEDW